MFNLQTLSNPQIVQDKNKLRVVAILIDRKKGKPVNCNSSLYPDGSMASSLEIEDENIDTISTEWYTLQGTRILSPSLGMGILIRVDRRADGSIKSTKQCFR